MCSVRGKNQHVNFFSAEKNLQSIESPQGESEQERLVRAALSANEAVSLEAQGDDTPGGTAAGAPTVAAGLPAVPVEVIPAGDRGTPTVAGQERGTEGPSDRANKGGPSFAPRGRQDGQQTGGPGRG